MSSTAAIQVQGLVKRYGEKTAVDGIDLTVESGEIFALLGPNGAGKTTLLHTIAGLLPTINGTVFFNDQPVTGLSTHQIVRQGLSLLPENRGIFYQLTVAENLRLYKRQGGAVKVEEVFEYFPALKPLVERKAGLLSGGEQQMLAIARALMSRPRLLLCDEPSLGLAPLITQELFAVLKSLNQQDGLSVLLVEQNANLALKVASKVYLLETGQVVASGTAEAIAGDERIRKAYLGG